MNHSLFESYHWRSEIFECDTNNIEQFYALLDIEKKRLGLTAEKLGESGDYPIWFMQGPQHNPQNPSILISAGFHGEEVAGPWGSLHLLKSIDTSYFEQVNLSLLPLVNPTGFAKGQRFNELGENPNHGYYFEDGVAKAGKGTSREASILIEHTDLLLASSRDGILTCHEDVLLTDTYIYTFEPTVTPGNFSFQLRNVLGQFFPIAQDGEIDDCPVRNGIIFNHFDTSFESFLVQQGTRLGCCSETPGQQPVDQRILANAAAMTAFIEMSAKGENN